MSTVRHSRSRIRAGGATITLLSLCSLAVLSLVPAAAQAAFPGANGRVAYTQDPPCPQRPAPEDPFGPDPDTEIFSINPDGSFPDNLSDNPCPLPGEGDVRPPRDDQPAYSPDGTKIAFSRNLAEIYVMNADGSGERQLTSGGRDQSPSFSPDGTKIIFTRVTGDTDLWTVPVAGGEPVQLTATPDIFEDQAVYSPDGTRLAVQRSTLPPGGGLPPPDIYTTNLDGSNARNITNTPDSFEIQPDFSPDGTKITFTRRLPQAPSGASGDLQVWSINTDGTNERQLTYLFENSDSVFSPDGTKIAFVSSRRGFKIQGLQAEIFTKNADGSGTEDRLTTGSVNNSFGAGHRGPTWQPLPRAAARGPAASPPVPAESTALAGCPALTANVIRGSAASNTINGTTGADRIFAATGNDVVDALAGNDCVDLGVGDDRGQGGLGDDFLIGGLGEDSISGSSGTDRLLGNGGDDRLSGNTGEDRILGGGGLDAIFGGFGNDRLLGESGSDRISGSRGRDQVSGGSGSDRISGESSSDGIRGDSGNDRLSGGSGSDRLRGNSGGDRISGGSGHDRIRGDQGSDRISGGSERDRISAGSGNDRVDVRDRHRDRVDCGSGRDSVIADRSDRVARNCERVIRRS